MFTSLQSVQTEKRSFKLFCFQTRICYFKFEKLKKSLGHQAVFNFCQKNYIWRGRVNANLEFLAPFL